jgi:hypothetical protein
MSNPTWQTERLGRLRPDQDLRPRLRRTSPPSVGDMANWAKIDAFYQQAAPDAGFTDVETLIGLHSFREKSTNNEVPL